METFSFPPSFSKRTDQFFFNKHFPIIFISTPFHLYFFFMQISYFLQSGLDSDLYPSIRNDLLTAS
jgi:hypothetical protein